MTLLFSRIKSYNLCKVFTIIPNIIMYFTTTPTWWSRSQSILETLRPASSSEARIVRGTHWTANRNTSFPFICMQEYADLFGGNTVAPFVLEMASASASLTESVKCLQCMKAHRQKQKRLSDVEFAFAASAKPYLWPEPSLFTSKPSRPSSSPLQACRVCTRQKRWRTDKSLQREV